MQKVESSIKNYLRKEREMLQSHCEISSSQFAVRSLHLWLHNLLEKRWKGINEHAPLDRAEIILDLYHSAPKQICSAQVARFSASSM